MVFGSSQIQDTNQNVKIPFALQNNSAKLRVHTRGPSAQQVELQEWSNHMDTIVVTGFYPPVMTKSY